MLLDPWALINLNLLCFVGSFWNYTSLGFLLYLTLRVLMMNAIYINNQIHLPCKYREGVIYTIDVFNSQFKISFLGKMYCYQSLDGDDDAFCERAYEFIGSSCGVITDAIYLAKSNLVNQKFCDNLCGDDSIEFFPEIALIRDYGGRLVLAGQVIQNSIRWRNPLESCIGSWSSPASNVPADENDDSSCRFSFEAYFNELTQVDSFWSKHSALALETVKPDCL